MFQLGGRAGFLQETVALLAADEQFTPRHFHRHQAVQSRIVGQIHHTEPTPPRQRRIVKRPTRSGNAGSPTSSPCSAAALSLSPSASCRRRSCSSRAARSPHRSRGTAGDRRPCPASRLRFGRRSNSTTSSSSSNCTCPTSGTRSRYVLDPRRMPRLPRVFKLVAEAVDLLFHLQRQRADDRAGDSRSWLALLRPQATNQLQLPLHSTQASCSWSASSLLV